MAWQDRPYYREEGGGNIPPVVFSFPKLTRLTMSIIGVCLVAFVAQSLTRGPFGGPLETWGRLTFYDALAFKQPWRWITYQYLHGGAGHFFFNMIGLYFFLPSLELMWGWRKAFAFYTAGGIAAGVTFGLLSLLYVGGGPMEYSGLIGASGSIFAAMGAVALLSPNRQLILLIFPVPIRVAVALFGAYFVLSSLADHNLSDAAHLGGLVFGFFAPWLAGPWLARFRRNWERRRAQRGVVTEQQEQATIDQILSKVHEKGMNSLSWSERRALKRATERQRQADLARARRVR
jgi:membrane associated rhomboid family serine protease